MFSFRKRLYSIIALLSRFVLLSYCAGCCGAGTVIPCILELADGLDLFDGVITQELAQIGEYVNEYHRLLVAV